METKVETVIIGGGQAGLSTSTILSRDGHEHIVLEKAAQAGTAWRHQRWDSFSLVTPNWMIRLPGGEYDGNDPDGYMPRDILVRYLEQYVERNNVPIRYSTVVTSVVPTNGKYTITTNDGSYRARNVVVATGSFQSPKIPSVASSLPKDILQLHSTQYRNPEMLPPGAVLVVGSAQSGCQIAEELYSSGRQVYLCVGSAGRIPRRYRGKDITWWLAKIGFFDRKSDALPSPKFRFAGNPHLTGKGGGYTLNLHQFVRDGVGLLGRLRGASDGKIFLAPDLKENLTKGDQLEVDILTRIDDFVRTDGLDAPMEDLPTLRDGYRVETKPELDLKAAGIKSVIYALGFSFDYSMVKLPIFDEDGYPIQQRGITTHPGLCFVGLNWMYKHKSTLFYGVGDDAAFIASRVLARDGAL